MSDQPSSTAALPSPRASTGSARYGNIEVTVTVHPPDNTAADEEFGPGFAWVRRRGVEYRFSCRHQRLVVAALWRACRLFKLPWLRREELAEAAEVPVGFLPELFSEHPAWGTLIVPALLDGGPIGAYGFPRL